MAPPFPSPKNVPLTHAPPASSGKVPPGGPTVTVHHFVITGMSVFPEELLEAQVSPYLGRSFTLAELYQVADVITVYYQSRGYGIARATIPEQQFDQGTVTIQVVEGRIGTVSLDGVSRTRATVIQKQASELAPGMVYTDAAMDRSVLLVNDLPGLHAQAVLQPGSVFGTADVVYKLTDDPLFSGQLSVDDYGRADLGRWRFNVQTTVASLTGSGDDLTANLTHSQDNLLDFGGLTYMLPLGPPSGRLSFAYNQSEYRVGGPQFGALELSGHSKNAGVTYLYDVLRARDQNLYWGGGFSHQGSYSLAKGKPVSNGNLNVAELMLFYNSSRQDGGFSSLNASFSTNAHHNDGNTPTAEQAHFTLDATEVMRFGGSWSLIARTGGAWSPDPLADVEKYSLGGPDSVRGLTSAEVRGDSGLFASLELQRAFAPFAVGVFLDGGQVWSKKFTTPPAPGCVVSASNPCATATTPGSATVVNSAGAELLFQSRGGMWQGRVSWAWTFGDYKPSDGNSGGHIWASFGMNF
jgi:hemolysin activation/secretion protein